ncbi:hypothetical protein H696_03077 [Fonticula alba]|uniref:Uncharacterized protein n=1 Tax=Fonticula alba TaxID=691883 RepID=A0A058Z9E2_FONAL|nr:hypothetical protein H696_03077 [Fonticula alba]KCV70726.1 hypothetical protein H696_03077 [Fonticula alba]|eukprot:XP_009495242.1 hypothetical protein H696_03077 [Fonticula alba]
MLASSAAQLSFSAREAFARGSYSQAAATLNDLASLCLDLSLFSLPGNFPDPTVSLQAGPPPSAAFLPPPPPLAHSPIGTTVTSVPVPAPAPLATAGPGHALPKPPLLAGLASGPDGASSHFSTDPPAPTSIASAGHLALPNALARDVSLSSLQLLFRARSRSVKHTGPCM